MKRLLFQVHRWVGIALALFMLMWFFSGLAIVYSSPMTQSRSDQLARAEILAPQVGWLSLGEAWERSAGQRREEDGKGKGGGDTAPVEARLVRQAGEPRWLVEDGKGRRFTLSAADGKLEKTSAADSLKIAARWVEQGSGAQLDLAYVETIDKPLIVRNQDALRPFHHIAVADGAGTELYISEKSGEVVHASSRFQRGLYWVGNWLHMLRPLDSLGLGEWRRDVLTWSAGFALLATVTGLIIGWLRWRPGWFGGTTYAEGRTQPYKAFWFKWHFWSGLVGGIVTLTWILSGYLTNNPWQIFSPAAPGKEELSRYVGGKVPATLLDWQPGPLAALPSATVELSWRRLGNEAVLIAHDREGKRHALATPGAVSRFDDQALLNAVQRLYGDKPVAVAATALQDEYDSYYYPRHQRGKAERPLPVLRVELDDAARTRYYLDPQDGRLLVRADQSRRVYRWLFSALHHWDIGWLYQRPLWDGWMVTWILFGLVLSVSSVVVGVKRLRFTLRPKKAKEPKVVPTGQLATDQQSG